MLNGEQKLLHKEGVIRLQLESRPEQRLTAGDFMPMAAKLNLVAPIDLGVADMAIKRLREEQSEIAINISSEVIADFNFRRELLGLLKNASDVCPRLLLEAPEYGVFRQYEAFRDLTSKLKDVGCRVGIEYFGQRFAESDQLTSLGLDYIKVHPGYVRGITDNTGNQEFLQGLCRMAHNLGMQAIAVGVDSPEEISMLISLGFDGVTGPGVKQSA